MDLALIISAIVLVWFLFKGGSDAGTGAESGGVVQAGGTSTVNAGVLSAPLNPDLDAIAARVAQVESGNRQTDKNGNTITSPKGALGIMQLMPATAEKLGVNPYNKDENIAGGRAYLEQLYEKFGNWVDALAAYNWGPKKVELARAQGKPLPQSVQGYVNSILGS